MAERKHTMLCINVSYSSLETDEPCGWHFQLINLWYNRRLHKETTTTTTTKPAHSCGTVHTKAQLTFQRAASLTTTVDRIKVNFMWLIAESQCSALNRFQMLQTSQLNKWAGTSHRILLACVRVCMLFQSDIYPWDETLELWSQFGPIFLKYQCSHCFRAIKDRQNEKASHFQNGPFVLL